MGFGGLNFGFGSSGGGNGGGSELDSFEPNDALYPAAGFASAGSRNGRPTLDFDDTTNESVIFEGVVSEDYSGGAVTVAIQYAMNGVVVGDVVWNVEFERIEPGVTDLDVDNFAAAKSVTDTVPATDGVTNIPTITFTNGEADSIMAGDGYRVRLTRDAASGSDTAAADAQVIRFNISQ